MNGRGVLGLNLARLAFLNRTNLAERPVFAVSAARLFKRRWDLDTMSQAKGSKTCGQQEKQRHRSIFPIHSMIVQTWNIDSGFMTWHLREIARILRRWTSDRVLLLLRMAEQFEQEPKLLVLFKELKDGFQKTALQKPNQQEAALKGLTAKMQEAKTWVSIQCLI